MKLSSETQNIILEKLAEDFVSCVKGTKIAQASYDYKIQESIEKSEGKSQARLAALNELNKPKFVKTAFDTRRINQETERIPRTNLQYYHRSTPFIDEQDQSKIEIFSKLSNVLSKLRKKLGTSPEWFESYTRQLFDNVNRILRVKQADFDVFKPQLSYLEQLIYTRYRLTMENLETISEEDLTNKILAKDEALIGRHKFLKETTGEEEKSNNKISKDGLEKTTQDSIVNAIFGASNNIRRDGERTVERIITISIRDNVID